MLRRLCLPLLPCVLALLSGCTSSQNNSSESISLEPDPAGRKYLLDQEPAGAKSVLDVRKYAKSGDDVVVVGQIGDNGNPWGEGRATFMIADTSFEPCRKCEDPFCEVPEDQFKLGRVQVKIVDDEGKVVAKDARTLLGLKVLDTVVVKGKVKQEGESYFILATALHKRLAEKK